MAKTLEDYKNEMLGKTFGWLTVLDVFRDEVTHKMSCKCQCKCGNITIKNVFRVYKGRTTSCGCYNSSKEKADKFRELCKNNPEIGNKISSKVRNWIDNNPDKVAERGKKYSEWCANNKDKLDDQAKRYSEWCKNNPDKVLEKTLKRKKTLEDSPDILINQGKQHHQYYLDHPEIGISAGKKISDHIKNNPNKKKAQAELQSKSLIKSNIIKRSANVSDLDLSFIHNDDLQGVLSGETLSTEKVRMKCPICGEYELHRLGNAINYSEHEIKTIPMCFKCFKSFVTSKCEREISDYISTFYSGSHINNSRDIISPFELDLYYPEKKIAIEFNGDYWHSSLFKNKDYHYYKFKQCRDLGIILVSIFESDWNSREQEIKDYLKDLFNGKENKLSLKENYMNNNFPSPISNISDNHIEENYTSGDYTIYTCGCSEIV